MLGSYPKILIPEHKQNPSVFDLLGSSRMDVWKATARSSYADNPSIAKLYQSLKISNHKIAQLLLAID